VRLPLGFFANVIRLTDDLGLAISADGVGTKVLIAQQMNRYDTIGIDCVAMNVNDIVCVGARPLSMVDYLAVQRMDPAIIERIRDGLVEGAKRAGISIPGGETAQVPDIIRGYSESGTEDGASFGFDLAGAAVGLVPLDRILVGQDIQPGDAVIGIASSGIHSNGLTMAREILRRQGLDVHCYEPTLARTFGEELLLPTHIYVREALDILDGVDGVRALIHITGGGFLNLTRVASETGYIVDRLPEPPPIFAWMLEKAPENKAQMFGVFNMGIGFCAVVPEGESAKAISLATRQGKQAWRIGHATRDPARRVDLPQYGLVGSDKVFTEI
jgi:phosphoribosylformylglycinamidine cyclo-ligase